MNTVVSFDQRRGSYSIGSSGLSFSYWYKTSDESLNEDSPNTDSCSDNEVLVINEDCGTENWCSDEEEMLQMYPEIPMAPSLIDSCSNKEVVVINKGCGMENWCSDEEEMLQTYSEMPMATSLDTAENLQHHNDNDDTDHNHGLLDITREDDIKLTCDFANYQLVYTII